MKNIPISISHVHAGFPSPAEDYMDPSIDINEYLVKNPPATFFIRVRGHSMINAGIYDNDILVVDRSVKPKNKSIVVCILNGDFAVKRLSIKGKNIKLISENSNYPNISIGALDDFEVWGVVTYNIHQHV